MGWITEFWNSLRHRVARINMGPSGVVLAVLVMLQGEWLPIVIGLLGVLVFAAVWAGEPKDDK